MYTYRIFCAYVKVFICIYNFGLAIDFQHSGFGLVYRNESDLYSLHCFWSVYTCFLRETYACFHRSSQHCVRSFYFKVCLLQRNPKVICKEEQPWCINFIYQSGAWEGSPLKWRAQVLYHQSGDTLELHEIVFNNRCAL